jgi:hypothetical protein
MNIAGWFTHIGYRAFVYGPAIGALYSLFNYRDGAVNDNGYIAMPIGQGLGLLAGIAWIITSKRTKSIATWLTFLFSQICMSTFYVAYGIQRWNIARQKEGRYGESMNKVLPLYAGSLPSAFFAGICLLFAKDKLFGGSFIAKGLVIVGSGLYTGACISFYDDTNTYSALFITGILSMEIGCGIGHYFNHKLKVSKGRSIEEAKTTPV